MKYKFLLFDADDTLFDFHQGEKNAFSCALADFGICEKDGDYTLYSSINASLWRAHERGEITKNDIFAGRFSRFLKESGRTADGALLNTCYKAHLATQTVLMPHAEEVLFALHDFGYRLFIITNGDKTIQLSRLSQSPITPYFEKVFISEDIGAAKPSEQFFEAVANAIDGFSKEKTLVIGDSQTSDILGANRFGIDACYVTINSPPLSESLYAKYTINSLLDLKEILLS